MNRAQVLCLLFATTSLALTGCDDDPDSVREPDNSARDNRARDNTGVNERDRDAEALTVVGVVRVDNQLEVQPQ